jgi:hypothetical protein
VAGQQEVRLSAWAKQPERGRATKSSAPLFPSRESGLTPKRRKFISAACLRYEHPAITWQAPCFTHKLYGNQTTSESQFVGSPLGEAQYIGSAVAAAAEIASHAKKSSTVPVEHRPRRQSRISTQSQSSQMPARPRNHIAA